MSPVALEWVSAVVQARGRATHYRHAGRGAAILALTLHDSPTFDRACLELARTARVILPAWRDGLTTDTMPSWVTDLLESFGLDTVRVFADAPTAMVAETLARALPDRIEAVLVHRDTD